MKFIINKERKPPLSILYGKDTLRTRLFIVKIDFNRRFSIYKKHIGYFFA
jgi:hypothetical protein